MGRGGLEDGLQELAGWGMLWVGTDLPRRTLLDDQAVVEEGQARSDLAGESHLVGHHDHRHVGLGGKGSHNVENSRDQFGIERRGGPTLDTRSARRVGL